MLPYPWSGGSGGQKGYQPFFKCTIIIVRDKKPISASTTGVSAPHLNDIYDFALTARPTSSTAAIASDWTFNKAFSYEQDRFQVLLKRTLVISAESGSGNVYRAMKKRIKVMQPTYYTNTSNVENAGPGRLYCFIYSNHVFQTPNDSDPPRYFVDIRESFTDA